MSTTEACGTNEAAMMEAWAQFATPGPHHEHFKKLEGKWSAAVKFWFGPGMPPQESAGKSKFSVILGGRYMKQKFEGTAMGQPFEGRGLTAYDNFRQEYIDTWYDSMGTSIMISRGTPSADGKVINYTATMDDAIQGRKDVPMRMVTTFIDDNTYKVEMYCEAPDGQEFQNMEIIYTRKD